MSNATIDRSLVRHAMRAPYLEREEEQTLANRWRDRADNAARNRIADAHMRLVISMAIRFKGFGLPAGDLVQEGYVGLLEAAARFEPDRNVRFSTYASWWIRAAMQDFILRNWSIVRSGTSSAQKALFFNLRRLRSRIAQGDRDLTNRAVHEEIAAALGVNLKDVERMDARISSPDASLHAPATAGEDNGREQIDLLESEEPLPDEQVTGLIDGERRHRWLHQALDRLNRRERRIIHARRLTEESVTLEELGQELGISKERVRQIESRALEKLKVALSVIAPGMAAA